MNNNTFVFFKETLADTQVQFDITPLLQLGETITALAVQPVSPVSAVPLIFTPSSGLNPQVTAMLTGGNDNISYGLQVLVTTNARAFVVLVAVSVGTNVQVPYTTANPQAYTDLVDTVEAGKAAIGTAIFAFPATLDPSGGYVNWELMDSTGVVYSSGNAYEYIIQSDGISNTVIARAVINVPSTIPESQQNQKYQLRYTLDLSNRASVLDPNQQYIYYSSENVTIIGLNTVPVGVEPSVEMQGDPATVSLVTSKLYDTVYVELYKDNTLLGSTRVPDFERVAAGYYYAAVLNTTQLPVSLESCQVVWKYSQSTNQAAINRESTALYVVNPSIMQAVDDVKAKINKARTTLYGTPDLLFPVPVIMTWLRRAMDNFNGSYGVPVSFTMTNAKGSIREFWLMYAELLALESQYIAEGEKQFDFAGAAISLTVDHTGYLDAAASKIQARLDNEVKPFKQNLIIKGAMSGDGSVDPSKLQRGAIGSVGITITPASLWGSAGLGLRGTIGPGI